MLLTTLNYLKIFLGKIKICVFNSVCGFLAIPTPTAFSLLIIEYPRRIDLPS